MNSLVEPPGRPHGWTPTDEPLLDILEAPEFVLDGVIAAGAVAIAGERGLGKTSVLIPMMMAVAGLIEYPLKASIRRRVFYITEDIQQAKRIIAAVEHSGRLKASRLELQTMFRLISARRLSLNEACDFPKILVGSYQENDCIDGTSYRAPPVVVLDTVNATLDLENLNDNSLISQAIARLRQAFGDIPLITVGHVAKASRGDAQKASFKGAGAWEDDTQQTSYLVSEASQRFLITSKRRFESDFVEFLIESHAAEISAVDKLKRTVNTKVFFGIPEAISKLEKAKAQKDAKVAAKLKAWDQLQTDILAVIKTHPGIGVTQIKKSVTGNGQEIGQAVDVLAEAGEIRIEPVGRAKKCYPKFENHSERYDRESNGE